MNEMFVFDLFELSGHNAHGPFVRKAGGEGIKGEKENEGNHKLHEGFREQGRWVSDCKGQKHRLTYIQDFSWIQQCYDSTSGHGHTGAANLRIVMYRYRGHKKTQGIEVGM